MNPISTEFNQFFKELAANNHKDWFDLNRKRYETHVKKPFEDFVEQLIEAVQKENKSLNPKPKDCIFRINRDIRFAKDKTPYKLNRSAAINQGGRKDMSPAGLYVEMGPEHVRVYRGIYMASTAEIAQIRSYMAKHAKTLAKLSSAAEFKKWYGEVRGEKAKRMPKDLAAAAEMEPLIFNKQWYYFHQMPAEKTTDPKLINQIMECYKAGDQMAKFLAKALH
jgi:uncharacterized protein (TIGR02453 family)